MLHDSREIKEFFPLILKVSTVQKFENHTAHSMNYKKRVTNSWTIVPLDLRS